MIMPMVFPTEFERYSVKEVLQRNVGDAVEDSITLDAIVVRDVMNIAVQKPLQIHLQQTRIDHGITIEADASFKISLPCVRCGKTTSQTLEASSFEEYIRDGEVQEDQYAVSSRLTIDLSQQIIDTIGLAIPDVVLCREDCAGLCFSCGVDLNAHPNHYSQKPDHKQAVALANSIKIR